MATIGDSTFLHSGIPPLIDAVYNKANITVVILDNSITAMTGGQDHPGTGRTLRGEPTHKVDYEAICRAVGVEWVRRVDPYEVGHMYQTLREAIAHKGVSVVISERPCVLDPVKIKGAPLAVAPARLRRLPVVHESRLPLDRLVGRNARRAPQGEDRPGNLHRLHAVRAGLPLRLHPAGGPMSATSADPSPAKSRPSPTGPRAAARNVMIVGVGGQGVLMISKALALIGQKQGFQVKQSEVHGMAKRGGVVFSHVRFGERSVVADDRQGRSGRADRARMGGRAALARLSQARRRRLHRRHAPHRAAVRLPQPQARRGDPLRLGDAGRNRRQGRRELRARRDGDRHGTRRTPRRQHRAARRPLGVDGLSRRATGSRPSNRWRRSKTRAINRKAFEAGRAWAEAARADPSLRFDAELLRLRRAVAAPDVVVTLEINAAWCKGCDICVKLCPERCLALNAEQVAVLTNPEACTGCHVCEWLCPDFAISVRTSSREPAVA